MRRQWWKVFPVFVLARLISGGMTGVNMRQDYEFNLKIRVRAVSTCVGPLIG